MMHREVPIATVGLIPQIDDLLISLLQSLEPEDWDKSTLARGWTIKDVAAHLLDGNIRSLSTSRDQYFPTVETGIDPTKDLVSYLNLLNANWVTAMKRVSPEVLIHLLSVTNKQYSDHLETLEPFEPAIFPVAWAGESESQNWFHIAREYTEKWHHQQQIRHAMGGSSPLFEQAFFKPYLDTSLSALPYTLRAISGEERDTYSLFVSGTGGGEWHLEYVSGRWSFMESKPTYAVTKIHIDDQVIWRLFSRQIEAEEMKKRIIITGKRAPAEAFLAMKAVMM